MSALPSIWWVLAALAVAVLLGTAWAVLDLMRRISSGDRGCPTTALSIGTTAAFLAAVLVALLLAPFVFVKSLIWRTGTAHEATCGRCRSPLSRWVIGRPPACPRCMMSESYDSTRR